MPRLMRRARLSRAPPVARDVEKHLLHVLPAVAVQKFWGLPRSTIRPCFIIST